MSELRHGSKFASSLCAIAVVLVVLSGRLTDITTGQPLVGVHVSLTGPARASTSTDQGGHYTLRNLRPGSYTITMSSDDVPRVRRQITIGKSNSTEDFTLCSTTLDYSCAGPNGPG